MKIVAIKLPKFLSNIIKKNKKELKNKKHKIKNAIV